jgi:hypothetical protein
VDQGLEAALEIAPVNAIDRGHADGAHGGDILALEPNLSQRCDDDVTAGTFFVVEAHSSQEPRWSENRRSQATNQVCFGMPE